MNSFTKTQKVAALALALLVVCAVLVAKIGWDGLVIAAILVGWHWLMGYWFWRDFRARKAQKAEAERAAATERERLHAEALRRERELHAAAQQRIRENASRLVAESERQLRTLREELAVAQTAIARAEFEFREGAFAPFWDAVEAAANQLARADLSIQALTVTAKGYRAEVAKLETAPPSLSQDFTAIPQSGHLAERLHAVVRQAQKSFEFSQIYEARRTNKLLVGGFSNLSHALDTLRERLGASIEQMHGSISSLTKITQDNARDIAEKFQRALGKRKDDETK